MGFRLVPKSSTLDDLEWLMSTEGLSKSEAKTHLYNLILPIICLTGYFSWVSPKVNLLKCFACELLLTVLSTDNFVSTGTDYTVLSGDYWLSVCLSLFVRRVISAAGQRWEVTTCRAAETPTAARETIIGS